MSYCTHCKKDGHDDSECWCTRVVLEGGGPMHTHGAILPKEAPGFHKLTIPELCRDRDHNFPSMLHVPAGSRFVHYCPTCGFKSAVNGIEVSL